MTHDRKNFFAADLVLRAAEIDGVNSVAGGQYRLSDTADFGGTYWATHKVRDPIDEFGVQFKGGAGQRLAEKYRARLIAAGFNDRDAGKNNGKSTFIREIHQLAGGRPNVAAIQEAKAALDQVFGSPPSTIPAPSVSQTSKSFVQEFREGLPGFIDLDIPSRVSEEMREVNL